MTTRKSAAAGPGMAERETASPPPPGEGMTNFGFRRVPAREKGALVRNHFDAVAKRYDLMNTLLSFGIHYLWKRTTLGLLQLKEGESVLDVCGGTGDLSVLAAKRIGPSGIIVLYDINRAMMEAGRYKSTHAAERSRILYVQGDAERAALASCSFDAVMVGFGIRNLTNREAGLREIHRVLKPGGRFVCLEFSRPTAAWFRFLYDFYSFHIMPALGRLFAGSRQAYTYLPESIRLFPSPKELSDIMKEIGFQDVCYRRLTNGIACVHSGVKQFTPSRSGR
ncbi:MAG: bifunctional demethylmenaquinone methyltransferase/2-methoxy-6-polyprenyl-1,4-benzoquinol methylase UbiE [Syntrophales bacterium]